VEARDEKIDKQTDGQDQHMMGPPSRKNGSITTVAIIIISNIDRL